MTESVAELARLVELARALQARCVGRSLTLSTAESCTGGLLGHLLTEVPGASDYYAGGVVAYSDEIKRRSLGVPTAILERHGAVSAQAAVAMADGGRRALSTDCCLAVTGIAGPTAASSSKPVGLTYVAVADPAGHDVRRFLWTGDRTENKRESARAALELLLERLA